MTLILTVNGPNTIWMLADRRLSYEGKFPKDDACKILLLETVDGVAILGYAGLGATPRGTQPSDWMSEVLRGRNLSLENSLSALADACFRELPPHMLFLSGSQPPAHYILIPAIVSNEVRFYSIDIEYTSVNRDAYRYRITKHVREKDSRILPGVTRFGVAGSGAYSLIQNKTWMQELLHLVRACDKKRIKHHVVANFLAALNYDAHLKTTDGTVGPRCIVVWRDREKSGADYYFTGKEQEMNAPSLPGIVTGIDMKSMSKVLQDYFQSLDWKSGSEIKIDVDALNAKLKQVPSDPNEKLH